jgi:hypothetical protein
VEQPRMTVRKIPVSFCNISQIFTPIGRWQRQRDCSERPIRDLPKKLILRPEMVQNGHGINADARPELSH